MSPSRWEMPPVYLQSGDPENENTPTLHAPGLLGARFTMIHPQRTIPVAGSDAGFSKRYQLIKTDSTMAVAPFASAVAWWADRTQYLVTTTVTTLGRGRIAGVFRNAISPGNYGCIQIGGPSPVKLTDASPNPVPSGEFVIPSATNAKAEVLAAGSAATYPALGRASSVRNFGNSTCQVELDVPETT